ncbi:MAG: hypothetical protein KTR33_01795 [Gammaproteobacteria bacterium]|nr:hypothetical protein [Gammaproteobacteria bacterium]
MKLAAIVAEANLAPSVHNTQPTRWTCDGNAIVLSLDKTRLLTIGDPTGRDARLSMGTALLGTRIAAQRMGLGVKGLETDEERVRIEFETHAADTWDLDVVQRRMTWRGGFAAGQKADVSPLTNRDDTRLTVDPYLIDTLAVLNDETSLTIMRNRAFRDELRNWMRLTKRHPNWSYDGLNASALGLGALESVAAGVVLRTPIFEVFDTVGLGHAVTGEAAKTRSAHAIAAFHRPHGEDPLVSGEAFYDLWLMLSAIGQAAWPMAALADDPDASAEVCRLMDVPPDQHLINVLRIGPRPEHVTTKARRISSELIDS